MLEEFVLPKWKKGSQDTLISKVKLLDMEILPDWTRLIALC